MIGRALILRIAALKPVQGTIRRSRIFRPLVSRFIAGDTLDESIAASEALLAKNLDVTLDYLGENTSSEAEALAARDTYMRMIDRIAEVPQVEAYHATHPEGAVCKGECFGAEPLNISIKLTQCGLDQGEAFAEANYRSVLELALKSANFVRVDMEASEYTQRTIDIVSRVFEEHKNTGTVLQSYLFRTDDDVDLAIRLQMRVRLVKGAYLEPASVAYADKAKVDEAFVRQAKRLLSDGFYPAIATHDESIIKELNSFVEKGNISKQGFEYQMLYGIRRDLQESLRRDGYNVRIYVPFGDKWYPYFTRRLAERPANSLFILKSLFKG